MLLVTGITGHSGKYFLQELIKHKYQKVIRCIVRRSSDTALLDSSGLKIEKVVGDIQDNEFLNKCMVEVTTVVHIVNIRHSINILNAAISNNVSRVICVHTTGIYSRFKAASSEYQIIENEIEKIVNEAKICVTILRPTMIYGDLCDHNMSKFIKMIDTLRIFPVINSGQCLIQPVNARDLGKAYYSILMQAAEKNRYAYILSGEKPITILNAFKLISNNLGKKTIFISVPLSFGVLLARILKLATLGKSDYIEKVQRMGEDRSFSHEEAIRDFGYSPLPFEEGIKAEVKEYLLCLRGR